MASCACFSGQLFALSCTGVPQKELEDLISKHGGTISSVVHKRVTFVVATEAAISKNTQAVRKAKGKFAIPLVTPQFLRDSITAGRLLDATEYMPIMSTLAPASPAAADEAVGMQSRRIEVFVEMTEVDQWWPVRVSAAPVDERHYDIVYEPLPACGYDEETPSKARFDPAGKAAKGVPDGALGRLFDCNEQCWRPWRDVGGSSSSAAPPPAGAPTVAPERPAVVPACLPAVGPAVVPACLPAVVPAVAPAVVFAVGPAIGPAIGPAVGPAVGPVAGANELVGKKRGLQVRVAFDKTLSKAQRKRQRRKFAAAASKHSSS